MLFLNTENITTAYDATSPASSLQARYLRFFTFLKQPSPVSFQVELLPTMRIHDVFHVDRLQPYKSSSEYLSHRSSPLPEPEVIDSETEYEVEAILAHKLRRRTTHFLLKWKGYDAASASTWEPLSRLTHCQDKFLKGEV